MEATPGKTDLMKVLDVADIDNIQEFMKKGKRVTRDVGSPLPRTRLRFSNMGTTIPDNQI